jgi:hypothetical protein
VWIGLALILIGGMETSALPPTVATRPLNSVQAGQSREVVTEIQIHGNLVTTDDEVRRLAGVEIGMPYEVHTVDEVAARLRAAKRFETVQVLKRFASIGDPSQIVLVIIVDEGPVRIEMTNDPAHPARVVRNRRPNVMFLPVLDAEDGYGATYGIRFALPDPVGRQSRVSFPLTWGGEKRAAVEFDKRLDQAPIDRVLAGGSISRRTNPFFREDDDRGRVWVRAEREVARHLRAGATGGWQHDSFLDQSVRFVQTGVDLILDTRLDPMLARDAVYARVAWDHLRGSEGPSEGGPHESAQDPSRGGRRAPTSANRLALDARGYIGLFGQTILALRAVRSDTDQSLPVAIKPLLGGMSSVRGFAAGTAIGDTVVATSAELIVPLTSPLELGKVGVSAFIDAGTIYDKCGAGVQACRLADQTWKRGYGGTVWFSAAFLRLNVAVAHGRGSSTRVHVGANVTF